MGIHDALFAEIQRRGSYPSLVTNGWERAGALYPETDDPIFIEKLLQKQEFAENLQESLAEQQRRKENPCDTQEEFELTPVQRFVSRFLSPQCPYVSALVFHGVGVGKTCTAITTAEEFLQVYPEESVFIIAPRNIQPGFRRTIFDDESLVISEPDGVPNTSRGCTASKYLKLAGMEYESDKDTIVRRINQTIKARYKILGYVQFYRYIQNLLDQVPKGLDAERREQEEIKILRREFSGRFVIIDEAHNLRDAPGETDDDNVDVAGGDAELNESKAGKRLTPLLMRVLEASEGMKLMLLTGTPMYNSYREIIFLLNLLLINDKKVRISEKDIFKPNGAFREGGEEKLGAAAAAYLSFMRGENPLSFPVRLKPQGVPTLTTWPTEDPQGRALFPEEDTDRERVKNILMNLPFVPVSFQGEELTQIHAIADNSIEGSGGLGLSTVDEMVQSGNWFFPSNSDEDYETRIRDSGFGNTFEEVRGATLVQYRNRFEPATWLATANLGRVSPKAAFVLSRIPKARGVIFVYSRFIKSGALPFAIALEANGYTPAGRDKPLFVNGVVDGRGKQCALCEKREVGHTSSTHKFTPAKYVLLTGQAAYSANNPVAIQMARSKDNTDGRNVKVVIGSQVASEGIDLRFTREIYVFDSWFHLNKMEQVLGRGVRTCSHALLPEAYRNCTIHLLVNSYGQDSAVETADMYMYRNATVKALQIGRVTRVLKRYALDCNLNHNAIFVKDMEPLENIEDSQGQIRPQTSINDTPFTSICDWMECPYMCAKPVDVGKILKEGRQNMATYDEYAMRWRESQIKKILKNLFEREKNPMIQIDSLIEALRTADIPEIAIRTVLANIVGQPSFRLRIGRQEGYIIYRNTYYLFQPIQLVDLRIPLALRVADIPVRKDEYEPSKITIVREAAKEAPSTEGEGEGTAGEGATAAAPKSVSRGNASVLYWNACLSWANKIITATSELDIPEEIQAAIQRHFAGDAYKREMNIVSMFSWMYENISRSPDIAEERRPIFLNTLATVLLEMIWDESLTYAEQLNIFNEHRTAEVEAVAAEQILTSGATKVFRYVNPASGVVEYMCEKGKCSEAVTRLFEGDTTNPLNTLQANRNTTGPIYGFIIPKIKTARLVFKTNERPVDAGITPEKGSECEIVSKIENHKELLRRMKTMILALGYPPFLLTDSVLDEKDERKKEATATKKKKAKGEAGGESEMTASQLRNLKTRARIIGDVRKFQNVEKACALKNIILRFIDILEKKAGRKRYFYRPVSAIKSKHRLN